MRSLKRGSMAAMVARHQQDNPAEWTPELIETTAAWSAVVRAITLDQQEALAALQGGSSQPSFVQRCATDPQLRQQLDMVCERQLHGLLMEWVVDGIKVHVHAHVAPHFWVRYRETSPALQQCGGRPNAALQRRCQANLFAAVRELHAYMGSRLQLAHLLEARLWADPLWTASAWDEHPWDATLWDDPLARASPPTSGSEVRATPIKPCSTAPTPLLPARIPLPSLRVLALRSMTNPQPTPPSAQHPSHPCPPVPSQAPMAISPSTPAKSPVPMEAELPSGEPCGEGLLSRCVWLELRTSLQALVMAFAPDEQAFDTWVRLSWQRSFIDMCREARKVAMAESGGGEEGGEGDESEEDSDVEAAEGDEQEGSSPPKRPRGGT